tara:strand:- start:2428 stop:2754 length:327 start_codon:yes stop_codon:yes gene_type:complete
MTIQEGLLKEIKDNTREAFSPGVVVYINDTNRHKGPFYAIQAISDITIDVSECNLGYIERAGTGTTQAITADITLPQGMTIYGNIESVELSTGTALAYARQGTTVIPD